jgi:hypothetical protein
MPNYRRWTPDAATAAPVAAVTLVSSAARVALVTFVPVRRFSHNGYDRAHPSLKPQWSRSCPYAPPVALVTLVPVGSETWS